MAQETLYPFGQNQPVPAGYPIADDLETDRADKALSARQGKRLKEMMKTPSTIPSILKTSLVPISNTHVIYTIDDFMLAHEYVEGSVDNLKFSNDLGKTWITIANTYGDIVNAFMFADGTFMMCTKKSEGCRAYWTRDFSTFTEATVLDYNGQPYSMEAGKTRFFTLKPKSSHSYVNGVEHYCFWDYTITTANPRLWYAISDENGVTVRAAFAFGLSTINGNSVPGRHGHAFDFNPYDGYFYAFTGDSYKSAESPNDAEECNVMKGRYIVNNGVHEWTWEILAAGGGYKLVSVSFDEGNLYAITDYTAADLADAKGVVSIPIDKIGITTTKSGGLVCPAKLRYWFHATKAFMKQGSFYPNGTDVQVAALSGRLIDNNGWRFIGTDYLGDSKHLIAKGDHNYVWVDNDTNEKFEVFFGPNNRGEVYATKRTPDPSAIYGEGWLRISHRTTFNLTEIMRKSGATDFFEGWQGTPY